MRKVGIIFDDSLNTATNVPFIDTIANILRDSKDKEEGYLPEEYKNVIIPMLVITRLDLVWADISDDRKARFKKTLEKVKNNPDCTPKMKEDRLKTACGKRFYNESGISLEQLKSADKDNLAKNFKEYIAGFSPNIKTLLKSFKFNDEIDKMKKCRVLSTVINQFWNNRAMFDPKETDDTAMGNMFEMVIRKYFATSSNGQFFTPREIISLMMNIIINSPDVDENLFKEGATINILDMACGTGGMLSVAESTITQIDKRAKITVNLFGQENDPKLHAVCLSDIIIKGQKEENIKCLNTLYEDGFPKEDMDFILANPPFGTDWKPSGGKKDEKSDNLKMQYKKILDEVDRREKGKYVAGIPSDGTDCQIMFIQHALHKLKESGKACIISNNKPLFAGDVGSGESNIRKWILDNDWLEAIIKLPGQMFYNTGINIYLNVFNKGKVEDRRNKILLIDASDGDGEMNFHRTAKRSAGDKRNELTREHVERIVKMYWDFDNTEYSKVIGKEDFMLMKFTTKQAYQCDFAINDERLENFRDGKLFHALTHGGKISEEQMNLLVRTPEDELEDSEKVNVIRHKMGIGIFERIYSALSRSSSDDIVYSMDKFIEDLQSILGYKQIDMLTGKLKKSGQPATKKTWVLSECDNLTGEEIKKSFCNKSFAEIFKMIAFDFGVHDEQAVIVEDANGVVYDDDTKDTETIQVSSEMSKSVTHELETDLSEEEKIKQKEHNTLYGAAWEEKMVERYLEKEVLPYAVNTHKVDEVVYGSDWSFNKQFYVYKPLPKSFDLLKEFLEMEKSIEDDLAEILSEVE